VSAGREGDVPQKPESVDVSASVQGRKGGGGGGLTETMRLEGATAASRPLHEGRGHKLASHLSGYFS
jgi:hypothetical protein